MHRPLPSRRGSPPRVATSSAPALASRLLCLVVATALMPATGALLLVLLPRGDEAMGLQMVGGQAGPLQAPTAAAGSASVTASLTEELELEQGGCHRCRPVHILLARQRQLPLHLGLSLMWATEGEAAARRELGVAPAVPQLLLQVAGAAPAALLLAEWEDQPHRGAATQDRRAVQVLIALVRVLFTPAAAVAAEAGAGLLQEKAIWGDTARHRVSLHQLGWRWHHGPAASAA